MKNDIELQLKITTNQETSNRESLQIKIIQDAIDMNNSNGTSTSRSRGHLSKQLTLSCARFNNALVNQVMLNREIMNLHLNTELKFSCLMRNTEMFIKYDEQRLIESTSANILAYKKIVFHTKKAITPFCLQQQSDNVDFQWNVVLNTQYFVYVRDDSQSVKLQIINELNVYNMWGDTIRKSLPHFAHVVRLISYKQVSRMNIGEDTSPECCSTHVWFKSMKIFLTYTALGFNS